MIQSLVCEDTKGVIMLFFVSLDTDSFFLWFSIIITSPMAVRTAILQMSFLRSFENIELDTMELIGMVIHLRFLASSEKHT